MEHVLLFSGQMGAGKSTAIQALSEIEVVNTDVKNTERGVGDNTDKATTTVAMDFGEFSLGPEEKVKMYGLPGQRRFAFMWQILKKRATGLILLVPNDSKDPIKDMLDYLEEFPELYEAGAVIIGISRSDIKAEPTIQDYSAALQAKYPGNIIPIQKVDPRNGQHMKTVLMSLVANIELREQMRDMK